MRAPAGYLTWSTDTYDEQYQQITDWARNQPNIIDAVIAYIESHSENGVLEPVAMDGRIRLSICREGLDVEKQDPPGLTAGKGNSGGRSGSKELE